MKSKLVQSQDELDIWKREGDAGSISDTGTEKEESRLRQLSVELHTHAGGNSSQVDVVVLKDDDVCGDGCCLLCVLDFV